MIDFWLDNYKDLQNILSSRICVPEEELEEDVVIRVEETGRQTEILNG